MHRLSAPSSRASASTLCQKCLKRGHYSYECTASAQSRPYTSRPSRMQQFLNPKLRPKLTSDIPNELLQKKGVADDHLAKLESERGRKRQRLDNVDDSPSRSISSRSSDSVSTISTNKSQSPDLNSSNNWRHNGSSAAHGNGTSHGSKNSVKRLRTSRSRSESRNSSKEIKSPRKLHLPEERRTRRRISSSSPHRRGRRRSRSNSNPYDNSPGKNLEPRSSSIVKSGRTRRLAERNRSSSDEKFTHRKNKGVSHEVYRHAQSMDQRHSTSGRNLSPFSKRLALTQAMNR